jgi:hypothetical protein
MRRRVVGENQDESKRPLKRRRTRHGAQRKPSMEECDGCCHHCLTRTATDNSAYYRTRVDCDKRDDLDHQSTIQSSPSSRAAVITAHLLLALLLGARRCRVCDTRVPLLSELPTTAAYVRFHSSTRPFGPKRTERISHSVRSPVEYLDIRWVMTAYLHPNSKAYEASLSFESLPRVERCIEVFECLPPSFLPSFHLTPPKWKKSQEINRGSWITSYPVDVPQGRQTRHWEFNI